MPIVKKSTAAKPAEPAKKEVKVEKKPATVEKKPVASEKPAKKAVASKTEVAAKKETVKKPLSIFKKKAAPAAPKKEGHQRTFETFTANVRKRFIENLGIEDLTLADTARIIKEVVSEVNDTLDEGKSLRLNQNLYIAVRAIDGRATKAPMASTETFVEAHKEAKLRYVPGGIDAIKHQGETQEIDGQLVFVDIDGNEYQLTSKNNEEETTEEEIAEDEITEEEENVDANEDEDDDFDLD